MDSSAAEKIYQTDPPPGYWEMEAAKGIDRYVGVLLPRILQPPARLLDLGCESGRTSLPLARMGYDVYGVDLFRKALVYAAASAKRESLPAHFFHARAQQLPFQDEIFDLALLTRQFLSTFHRREVRLHILRETRRVLKPGGQAVLSLQNQFLDPGLIHLLHYLYARAFIYSFPPLHWKKFYEVGRKAAQFLRNRVYLLTHSAERRSRDILITTRVSEVLHHQVPIHLYHLDELLRDLRDAGFESTGLWDRLELEKGAQTPAFLRRGAPYLIITAKRV